MLIVLFSLFLEGVEPNLLRHVCVKKRSHFPNMLNFCLFLNVKSFSGIIKLPKNVSFTGFFMKPTKTRVICMQTVPKGGLYLNRMILLLTAILSHFF